MWDEQIALAEVISARLNLEENTLEICQGSGADFARQPTVISFSASRAADDCFMALCNRLSPGVDVHPEKPGAWSVARTPLLALLATISLTLILAFAASGLGQVAEAHRAGVPTPAVLAALAATLGSIPWEVICGLGGVLAGIIQVWLYRRLTEPPRTLVLARASVPPCGDSDET